MKIFYFGATVEKDVVGGLPEFNQDYIFSYILNSYGLLAGIFVAAILAALVVFLFGRRSDRKMN